MEGRRKKVALLGLVAATVLGALVAPRAASAYDRPALLERVASVFAAHPAEIRCPSMEEWINDPLWSADPTQPRAWGYTNIIDDYSVLQPVLCAGAAAIADTAVPAWERATGALVLVHESFHLRHWGHRLDEARVECRAIRNFTYGAELLGASPQLANDLLPFALAAHDRMVRLYPEYRDPTCKLPLWKLPMTP
jgi:hypothetical protein